MNKNTNSRVFFVLVWLVMTVFIITGVNAQTHDSAPEADDIKFADMPAGIPGYTPHSGTYKATIGTIASDVDRFMSVLDFSALKMQKWFSYVGIDEGGVNLGYAVKLGSAYAGISYGGSLIDEVLRRITNQDILTLQKRDKIKKDSSGTSATPGLVDAEGKTIEGITTSENTIGLIFGTGIFGLKLGFAAYLEGRETGSELEGENYQHAFESSLKPSLELGWNFPAGSMRTKLGLRGAYDIHQYISVTGETYSFFSPTDPSTIESNLVKKDVYQDFTEPSGGFTLGFEFGLGDTSRAEVDLIGDVAFRIYRNNEQDGIITNWEITNDATPPVTTETEVTAPEIFDLRISGKPVFSFSSDVSDTLTIGAKIGLAFGYDVFTISQSFNNLISDAANPAGEKISTLLSTVEISDSHLSVIPELAVGTRFTLWPEHFSVHAGFGIDLFSYDEIVSSRTETIANVDTETTDTLRILELPSTKLAVGMTLNLTPGMALDLLAITSGLNIDTTKLTVFLTLEQ